MNLNTKAGSSPLNAVFRPAHSPIITTIPRIYLSVLFKTVPPELKWMNLLSRAKPTDMPINVEAGVIQPSSNPGETAIMIVGIIIERAS